MHNARVVCIGNVTYDKLLQIDDIPQLDDVAYVNQSVECLGGRGAIIAIILGRLMLSPALITAMPENKKAYEFVDLLKKNGVNTEYINIDNATNTLFEVIIAISKMQQNCISFFKPSNVSFNVTSRQIEVVKNADIAYFSTHKKSFNKALMNEIDSKKTYIVHNVSNYFLQDQEYVDLMLQKSSVFIFNELEGDYLLNLLGVDKIEDIFAFAPNLDTIYATKGIHGSMIYKKNDNPINIEIEQANTISPVGAGDAYSAGILYGIVQNWDVSFSAHFASKLASISVESETSYPDLERIDLLLKSLEGSKE